MRPLIFSVALLATAIGCGRAPVARTGSEEVLSVADASQRQGERVTVRLTLVATSFSGYNGLRLNSEVDFRNPANFTVFFSDRAIKAYQASGVSDLEKAFLGKTVEVTGEVTTMISSSWPHYEWAGLVVDDPASVKFVGQ